MHQETARPPRVANDLNSPSFGLLLHDQHAAMTEELEELADVEPDRFGRREIWILIRAIKVQSQILQMFTSASPCWKPRQPFSVSRK